MGLVLDICSSADEIPQIAGLCRRAGKVVPSKELVLNFRVQKCLLDIDQRDGPDQTQTKSPNSTKAQSKLKMLDTLWVMAETAFVVGQK